MNRGIEDRIRDLLDEKFKEAPFDNCFLIEIKLHDHRKLDVYIDSDDGINFDRCRQISRYLEKYIDEGGWLGEKYVLEVSSPGIGRPLKFPRQYHRNIGRKMEVAPHEGPKVSGILVAVNETDIVLENKVRIKEGKKKRTEIQQIQISFEDIKKAIVKISF
ncbi:MAG: ribosome assembly cofactor RimP [Bacteroidota bacterium]